MTDLLDGGCSCFLGGAPCSFCTDTFECERCGERVLTEDQDVHEGEDCICDRCHAVIAEGDLQMQSRVVADMAARAQAAADKMFGETVGAVYGEPRTALTEDALREAAEFIHSQRRERDAIVVDAFDYPLMPWQREMLQEMGRRHLAGQSLCMPMTHGRREGKSWTVSLINEYIRKLRAHKRSYLGHVEEAHAGIKSRQHKLRAKLVRYRNRAQTGE